VAAVQKSCVKAKMQRRQAAARKARVQQCAMASGGGAQAVLECVQWGAGVGRRRPALDACRRRLRARHLVNLGKEVRGHVLHVVHNVREQAAVGRVHLNLRALTVLVVLQQHVLEHVVLRKVAHERVRLRSLVQDPRERPVHKLGHKVVLLRDALPEPREQRVEDRGRKVHARKRLKEVDGGNLLQPVVRRRVVQHADADAQALLCVCVEVLKLEEQAQVAVDDADPRAHDVQAQLVKPRTLVRGARQPLEHAQD